MSANPIPNPSADGPLNVWREAWLALLVAVVCYWVSCVVVAPAGVATGFGIQWEMMSEAPLDLRGQLPQRILGPLLASFLGLAKPHFLLFTRGLSILLLAMVCFACRKRGAAMLDAVLVTVAIAATGATQMYKQQWAGYTDPLCYTLFFASLLAAKNAPLFWGLFLANLLNHELAVFLLPWLWFLRREANGRVLHDVLGAGAALGVYGAFYLWVRSAAQQQLFNASYFAQNPMFPGGTVVIVLLAVTHLVTAFGPVLAVVAWHSHTRAHGRERWHTALVLAGVGAIFCIAWDWSRHSNLIVLPLMFASLRFLQAGHRVLYAGLVALGVGLMQWVPPWPVMAWPTSAMAATTLLGDTGAAIINPVTRQPMGGPLRRVLTEWLPAVLPVLSVILLIAVAIWVAGFLLARLRKDPASPAA